MEIESIWNGVKPFSKNEKGAHGYINYGYRTKSKDRVGKCEKRKTYRQIRKHGFDLSETWGLDDTILRWMSDTFGGFFRLCGCPDDWGNYDFDGNYVDFWEHRNDEDYIKHNIQWEKARFESFRVHLKDFLDNATPEDYKKIATFCCPRLRMLAKVTHGYPGDDTFPAYEDWIKELNNMADKFEEGTYSPFFISHFFSLWD